MSIQFFHNHNISGSLESSPPLSPPYSPNDCPDIPVITGTNNLITAATHSTFNNENINNNNINEISPATSNNNSFVKDYTFKTTSTTDTKNIHTPSSLSSIITTPSTTMASYSSSSSITKLKKAPNHRHVRMRICDAPKNLLKLINNNFVTPSPQTTSIISGNNKININNISSSNVSNINSSNNGGDLSGNISGRNINQTGSIATTAANSFPASSPLPSSPLSPSPSSSSSSRVARHNKNRHYHRKSPYPIPPKIPSSTPSFTLRSTVYELYISNPQKLIDSNMLDEKPPFQRPRSPQYISSPKPKKGKSKGKGGKGKSGSIKKTQSLSFSAAAKEKVENLIKILNDPHLMEETLSNDSNTDRIKSFNNSDLNFANNNNILATSTPSATTSLTTAMVTPTSSTATKPTSTINSRSGKLPAPLPMDFDTLMKAIDQLKIDHSVLDNVSSRIIWKGQPLKISSLPNYNKLHAKEAEVASILRLTPTQYLTAKHTLVSASRKYIASGFEFRKSDAQKLLRIDVNKASKLWEFFSHVNWF